MEIDIGKSNVEKNWVDSLGRVKSVGPQPQGRGLAVAQAQSSANLYTSSIVMNEMLHGRGQAGSG